MTTTQPMSVVANVAPTVVEVTAESGEAAAPGNARSIGADASFGDRPEPESIEALDDVMVVQARTPSSEEQAGKRELLRKLEADRVRLMLHSPFTASLALHLKLVPLCDWRVPTAATDGEHVYFDVQFANTLTPEERLFVLAHEVWHNAMDHVHRRGQRERELWGLATDSEINALLFEDGLNAPRHAVLFENMKGRSAEQIYAWLRDRPAGNRTDQRSFDVHEPNEIKKPATGSLIQDPDFIAGNRLGSELRREWQQHLATAGIVAAQRGALPAGLAHVVASLLKPRVHWSQVLRHFLQRTRRGSYSWSRISRRHIWRSSWMPGRSETQLRVVVGLDTSGSTSDLQGRFLSELRAIMRTFRSFEILILECDTKIHRETRVTPAEGQDWLRTIGSGGVLGGGGTSFLEIFKRADQEQPDALILFTDGFGVTPERPSRWPVLWVLAGSGTHQPAPWGQVLRLAQPD